MLQTEKINYVVDDVVFEGYCAVDTSKPGSRKPVVLVAPDYSGRNDFACQKAEQFAELGYVGFALDMYGNAKLGKTPAEKQALMQPLMTDRKLLRQRVLAGFHAVQKLETVNAARIAAVGFCFGGTCLLDLARSGAELRGVVSVHGGLGAPDDLPSKKILAKILVLHGHDDPLVPPSAVSAFQAEMVAQQIDWQVHVYGGAQHGFTNPQAHDTQTGIVYNQLAAKRAWLLTREFLTEIFS